MYKSARVRQANGTPYVLPSEMIRSYGGCRALHRQYFRILVVRNNSMWINASYLDSLPYCKVHYFTFIRSRASVPSHRIVYSTKCHCKNLLIRAYQDNFNVSVNLEVFGSGASERRGVSGAVDTGRAGGGRRHRWRPTARGLGSAELWLPYFFKVVTSHRLV